MKNIFRVEYERNNCFYGMYNCNYIFPMNGIKHPGPYSDKLLRQNWDNLPRHDDYYFGFKDIHQFFNWCDPWYQFYEIFNDKTSYDSGKFWLSIYKTSTWIEGETQTVFVKGISELLHRTDNFEIDHLKQIGEIYGNKNIY